MSARTTRVLQHHYNALTQKWSKAQSEIQIEEQPFAEGAFRAAYRCTMPWEGVSNCRFVCKFARDPATPRSMYFNDVEAHEIATLYARQFNERLPEEYPRISYVSAFCVELVDRPGRPVCGCEQQLEGKFKKYNNNVGAVCALTAEEEKEMKESPDALENWHPTDTAQAFSHFSFDSSGGTLLICDIQGAANRFTDPQVHTLSGKGFGLGNLGQTGIRAFMLRHQCNSLCRAVGLQPIKARDMSEKAVAASSASGGQSAAAAAASAAGYLSASAVGGSGQKRKPTSQNSSNSSANAGSYGGSDVLTLGDDAPAASAQQAHQLRSSASTALLSGQAAHAAQQSASQHALQLPQGHRHQPSSHRQGHRASGTQPPTSASAASDNGRGAVSDPSTPAHSPSPSSSPRTGSTQERARRKLELSPAKEESESAAGAAASPKGLDDSDEALMASILAM